MRRAILVFGLIATVAAARAHDASLHRGKPTDGVVAALDGDHLTLDRAGGHLDVVLQADTKIEDGDDAVGRDRLSKGAAISVFGTKLATGELVAREILLRRDGAGGHDHGGH